MFSASSVSTTSLVFDSVGRGHIGSYMCIASNGVPPSISKRADLKVQCECLSLIRFPISPSPPFLASVPPMMTVPSQLEGVRLGSNVTLRCKSEAFPASINYWVRGQRAETVSSGPRLRSYSVVQDHVTHMKLEIVR